MGDASHGQGNVSVQLLLDALTAIHEYQCGGDRPGNLSACVSQPCACHEADEEAYNLNDKERLHGG